MRIVYGIHGYGRGHATRALAVLPDLKRRHDLLILAGGDAYDALCEHFPVVRIPTLGYSYRAGGTRSNWLTFRDNAPGVLDLLVGGPALRAVMDTIRGFAADAAISDAEPWTHRAAARLGVPRIGFDHFGVMVHCRPEMGRLDRLRSLRDAWVYRLLMGIPDRAIVSSFYDAPPRRAARGRVRTIGTLLRRDVFDFEPSVGEHLLAYFNKGVHLFSSRIERALRVLDVPVRVYGTRRLGVDGNLEYRPPGNRPFLADLASCRAVISTAGNQLVGEALHYGKPMLVTPEDCVEQRVNARAVERLGIGVQVALRRFTADAVRAFLARGDEFRADLDGVRRDSRREALETLETLLAALTGRRETKLVRTNVA